MVYSKYYPFLSGLSISQGTCIKWLQNGDRNTKFFHACASQRNKRNNIKSIMDINGISYTQPGDVERAFVTYFQTILTTSNPSYVEECISGIESKVT